VRYHQDCNVTLTLDDKVYWESRSGSYRNKADVLTMQEDGDLVARNKVLMKHTRRSYHIHNEPIWRTGTEGNRGAYMMLETYGVMKIYDKNDKPIWATNVLPPGPDIDRVNLLLSTEDRRFEVRFQPDGNVVIYRNVPTVEAIWATHTDTGKRKGDYIRMDGAGNFSVYMKDRSVGWTTNTASPGAFLKLENDGCLSLFSHHKEVSKQERMWTSLGENWMSQLSDDTKVSTIVPSR